MQKQDQSTNQATKASKLCTDQTVITIVRAAERIEKTRIENSAYGHKQARGRGFQGLEGLGWRAWRRASRSAWRLALSSCLLYTSDAADE